jgi:hypothetical protein
MRYLPAAGASTKTFLIFVKSVSALPANELANVSAMKSIDGIETIRDVENWLRDSVGLTKTQAVGFIARFKSAVRSESEGDENKASIDAHQEHHAISKQLRKITMSELAQIQKAIEDSRQRCRVSSMSKKARSNRTARSPKTQDDLIKVQEELKAAGTRLFDLEQKFASGAENPGIRNHSLNAPPKS